MNPCQPSPCGPNSQCREIGDAPSCSCLPEFVGTPPNCKPECISNTECPNHLACISQKCRDPCPGSCGQNSECKVLSHTPNCVCISGYVGNPFISCQPKREEPVYEKPTPCIPSPCGANAVCREHNGAGSCSCLEDFIGNPYEGCRPECVLNSDCTSNKACISGKCKDPCPGTCGANADCQVVNHLPTCTCRPSYSGDPFSFCHLQQRKMNQPLNFSRFLPILFQPLKRNPPILAKVVLVDQIVNAAKLTVKQFVHVYQNTAVVHLIAVQNVLLVRNALLTRLV